MYKIGKTYAGLKVLDIENTGTSRETKFYVEHVVDCGAKFSIGYNGIYMRQRHDIADTCMKCSQRKRYKLPKIEKKKDIDESIKNMNCTDDYADKYMPAKQMTRKNM